MEMKRYRYDIIRNNGGDADMKYLTVKDITKSKIVKSAFS